jgi:hypothetical protein
MTNLALGQASRNKRAPLQDAAALLFFRLRPAICPPVLKTELAGLVFRHDWRRRRHIAEPVAKARLNSVVVQRLMDKFRAGIKIMMPVFRKPVLDEHRPVGINCIFNAAAAGPADTAKVVTRKKGAWWVLRRIMEVRVSAAAGNKKQNLIPGDTRSGANRGLNLGACCIRPCIAV